jgi:hypothetical protein
MWIIHPVRAVDEVEIVIDLVAQIPLGDRVRRISLDPNRFSRIVVDGDKNGAGVGTTFVTQRFVTDPSIPRSRAYEERAPAELACCAKIIQG